MEPARGRAAGRSVQPPRRRTAELRKLSLCPVRLGRVGMASWWGAGAESETRQIFANVESLLHDAGGRPEDLLKLHHGGGRGTLGRMPSGAGRHVCAVVPEG
jgi:hypothetical protein